MLNESEWPFESEITDRDAVEFKADMRYPRDRHLSVNSCNLRVEWNAEIDTRSWGIKDINCYVRSIVGSINLEGFEEIPGEAEGQDVELVVEIDKSWTVESRWDEYAKKSISNRSLVPTHVDVDELKKHVIVYFV